jgi:hypothetical protein
MVTAFIEIALFLGLAIYVVTRNPRRPISWVFGAFCFTVINHYLSSLFLFLEPELPPPVTFFLLRRKWVAVSFAPALYLHLVSFYFSPAWRRYQLWGLGDLHAALEREQLGRGRCVYGQCPLAARLLRLGGYPGRSFAGDP